MEYFEKYFGENIYKYVIVLFICKDDLDDDNLIIDKYIELFFEKFKNFIKRCGNRKIVFNNRLKGE